MLLVNSSVEGTWGIGGNVIGGIGENGVKGFVAIVLKVGTGIFLSQCP